MNIILKLVSLSFMAIITFGCSHNYYNVPRESYEKKVRVLGVAPLFMDGDSDISHPEKEALLNLIKGFNRKNEKELVALLKETGVYFSVRMLDTPADQLFPTLFFRRERRTDAGVFYNKYFFKQQDLKELLARNNLDALMVVGVSGIIRPEKIYASNLMSYLESDYNYMIMTAQILDADGNILWEYPNFQKRSLSLPPMINLQYPDFDEAQANLTDHVQVKFKTIPGIGRAFEKTGDSIQNNTQISKIYSTIFNDMASMLQPKFRFFWEKKEEAKPAPATPETRDTKP